MKIVFRVDASVEMGTGHVMRCLTLADGLRDEGAICHFITRTQQGDLSQSIESRNHYVHLLPEIPFSKSDIQPNGHLPHASWLKGGWERDADECSSILKGLRPQWLIVDHYGIDYRWERLLSGYCKNIMVIDDLADRTHHCDVLFDQNWHGPETQDRYNDLVLENTIKLLGPGYALLRPDYPLLRSLMPPRDGHVSRLMIFMGGSDAQNETEKAMKALSSPDLKHLILDVVLGTNHPDTDGIRELAGARSNVNVHQNLPGLAGLMVRADLMVGAGGATTWERMCLGLPSIIISIARNQTPTNQALMEEGFINFLGESSMVSEGDIADAVRQSISSPGFIKRQSQLIGALVPGDGTEKAVSHLIRS